MAAERPPVIDRLEVLGRPKVEFDHKRDRRSLQHRYDELDDEVRRMAEAALENEKLTRTRVKKIEEWLGAFTARSRGERLRWLLTGR